MAARTADASLPSRMIRASQLNGDLYEEVERDVNATGQAATVVAIVAVATGIARIGDDGIFGFIFGVLAGLIGWVVWAAVTYWVGKTIFKAEATRVTLGEMLRTLGFAHSPGVLNVLGFIPVIGWIVLIVVSIWRLILGVIAIRAAMDFSTGRAIGTALVGWLITVIVSAVLFGIAGALS